MNMSQVWYEVGKQLNVCNDGKRAPETIKQCYNDTSTLDWLETNVKIVRNHPAILGYYICDVRFPCGCPQPVLANEWPLLLLDPPQ